MLVGAFAIVLGCLVASTVALGRAGWSVDDLVNDQNNPQAQRDDVMTLARSFVTEFSKYGPEDLDEQKRMPGYAERVGKYLTPKFRTNFEQSVTIAEQSVAQSQITRVGQVYAVAVSRLEEDSARVLVAGADQVSIPNPQKPKEQLPYSQGPFRYEVDLVWTQGEWLVDNFGPVGTLDGATQDQLEQPPTEAPTSPGPETGQGDGGDGE